MESNLSWALRATSERGDVHSGVPLPLGAFHEGDGINFALFSRHATTVWLELYDHTEDATPSRRIELDPVSHRTGDVWHVWVRGVTLGQLYAYRVDGPHRPERGHRFNPHKLLLDPCATAVTKPAQWDYIAALGYDPAAPERDLSLSQVDSAGAMPKCVVTDGHFDWEDDRSPRHPWHKTLIYETHVRGLTIHPSSGAAFPGTYQGLTAKIPYLKDLGVTAVELMPVQEFNENELARIDPATGERLRNYWGYSPVAFMAPESSYCHSGRLGHQVIAFRQMVKALHRAGIEVILDVVFTHTAESDELGPTISWRGLDNVIYYQLESDRRFYRDFTGTGNSINANHPVVRGIILMALRHWVIEMHVDGFRFDLASVLGRDRGGNLLPNTPLLERIAEDPILRSVKIIAEAWDAAGAYQVGSFSESRWAEWNGRFRDDVRRFWRGDAGMVADLASRIAGSSDLYEGSGKGPERSINFITSHDGFTLNDLVSYKQKHNRANGEDNRDGMDANWSDNYGIEGATHDPEIEAVRVRQIKNLLLTLFVSRGVPMLLGGDEFRRTQKGNNNAYAQDNETSWYDWSLLARHAEIHRFVQGMIRFRRDHPVLSKEMFYTTEDIGWFDPEGNTPDWAAADAKSLGVLILGDGGGDLYLAFNADEEAVEFALPVPPAGCEWRRAVDTTLPSPGDLLPPGQEAGLEAQDRYLVGGRGSAILIACAMDREQP